MSYYGGDPYSRPPPGPPAGYDQRPPYDNRPPYDRAAYSAPPPTARPPPGPPPPLPAGWHQEWEPNMRRAFWVEDNTGRAQWEPPYGPGYYDGSRSVEPQGGYYAAPPAPPPVGYGGGPGYQQQPAVVVEEKKSNAGKYLAAGAAGLALGGLAGAFIEHEHGEL